MHTAKTLAGAAMLVLGLLLATWRVAAADTDSRTVRNVIFILSDDHRHDFMSFVPTAPKFLETPHLDRMAAQGAHLANAFVSTSLCSPSRASILTGQYMHHHRVADNQRPEPKEIVFFPEYLQKAGYQTAMIGKWHMGHDSDEPRKGFTYWASFRGQGSYFNPTLNVNGRRQKFEGYTADVLTDQAIDWIKKNQDAPFFLYLSHKSVHHPFEPAPRHRGRYAKAIVPRPVGMANTETNYETQPRWVRDRRYGIHGVDHMETGPFDNDPVPSFDDLVRSYCEAVHGLDENIGRVMEHLRQSGLDRNTLVLYMGDNGFALGEHGLYDKRDAFETSIRVPLLAWVPSLIKPATHITQMVQNIDIAPTVLDATGVPAPANAKMDGRSFWPLLLGQSVAWRDHILYEYYWEWNFPATPTMFAIRTNRWKFIYYHGVWDKNSLYDLENDPVERHNLINVPAFREKAASLQKQLFDELEASGGLQMPVFPPAGEALQERKLPR